MSLEQKVQLVENLFHQLEQESAHFQQVSGLGCEAGCGKCCSYPDIVASPLEFLPWAYHLFLNDEAEKILEVLNQTNSKTCLIYERLSISGRGRCSNYKYRGLICRLFGFAANTDKYGSLRLATCKIIKEGQSEKYEAANQTVNEGVKIPVFSEYYMQLNNIDYHLGKKILPVNEALKMALEEVLQYFYYRPIVDVNKKCS